MGEVGEAESHGLCRQLQMREAVVPRKLSWSGSESKNTDPGGWVWSHPGNRYCEKAKDTGDISFCFVLLCFELRSCVAQASLEFASREEP